MIDRRTLLQTAAGALAAPALVGLAQAPVTLKFHTFMAPQSHVWLNMHQAWMERVSRDSGGRIRFEGYPAMQLGGSPAQLIEQVRDGVVDIAWTLPGYTAGRFPRIEAFELPFMLNQAEATSKALWDFVQTAAPDEFKDVHPLALHVHGPGVLHMRDRPVRSVDDLRGAKIRGPSRQVTKLLQQLGATPVGMPLPQVADALTKGVIDGCVLPWEVVPSVKVHELTRHHSEFAPAGGALYTATFVMAMNKARYLGLPPDLKAVIDRHSGRETSGWLGRVQQLGDAPARQAALARGNTVHTLGPAEAQAFRRLSRRVEVEWMQDMDQRGHNGRQLLESARTLIARATGPTGKPA